MRWTARFFILLLALLASVTLSSPLAHSDDSRQLGLFSGIVAGTSVGVYNLTAQRGLKPDEILRKYLPKAPTDGKLSNEQWKTAESGFRRAYGNDDTVQAYLRFAEKWEEKKYTIQSNFATKGVPGKVGEGIMHEIFKSEEGGTWQPLEGQRGVQGIDGIYVRKNANGTIKKVLIAESKTGASKLSEGQMSWKWIEDNIQKLIKRTESEILSADSSGNAQNAARLRQQLKDYKQLQQHVANRSPRRILSKMKIEDGHLVIEHYKITGEGKDVAISREPITSRQISLKFRPQEPFAGMVHDSYFDQLEKALSAHKKLAITEQDSKSIVAGVKSRFRNGEITNSKQLSTHLKEEFAKRGVAEDTAAKAAGKIVKQENINAEKVAENMAKRSPHALGWKGLVVSSALSGALITAGTEYLLTGRVDLRNVGEEAAFAVVISSATKVLSRLAVTRASSEGVESAARSAFSSSFGKFAGVGIGTAIVLGTIAYDYHSGQIGFREVEIQSAIGLGAVAVGFAAGSFIPVVGNAAGAVVGTAVAVGGALYYNNYRIEQLRHEAYIIAQADSEYLRKISDDEKTKLENKAAQLHRDAVVGLFNGI